MGFSAGLVATLTITLALKTYCKRPQLNGWLRRIMMHKYTNQKKGLKSRPGPGLVSCQSTIV